MGEGWRWGRREGLVWGLRGMARSDKGAGWGGIWDQEE